MQVTLLIEGNRISALVVKNWSLLENLHFSSKSLKKPRHNLFHKMAHKPTQVIAFFINADEKRYSKAVVDVFSLNRLSGRNLWKRLWEQMLV